MIILRKISPQKDIRISENLTGAMDGVNKTFNTLNNYKSGRISVLYNGQALHNLDDFTESGEDEVTFIYISPYINDVLRVTYEVDA